MRWLPVDDRGEGRLLTRVFNLQRLGDSVPDWSQVRRKGMGVRRDPRDALSNMVSSAPWPHTMLHSVLLSAIANRFFRAVLRML